MTMGDRLEEIGNPWSWPFVRAYLKFYVATAPAVMLLFGVIFVLANNRPHRSTPPLDLEVLAVTGAFPYMMFAAGFGFAIIPELRRRLAWLRLIQASVLNALTAAAFLALATLALFAAGSEPLVTRVNTASTAESIYLLAYLPFLIFGSLFFMLFGGLILRLYFGMLWVIGLRDYYLTHLPNRLEQLLRRHL